MNRVGSHLSLFKAMLPGTQHPFCHSPSYCEFGLRLSGGGLSSIMMSAVLQHNSAHAYPVNKFFTLAALCLLLPFHCESQTNVIYTTNFVVQPANFRGVNGTVYNITNSPLWTNISGRVWVVPDRKLSNIVIIEKDMRVGLGTNAPEIVALTNFGGNVVQGDQISTMAMRVGSIRTGFLMRGWSQLWDCGTNTSVPVITTNEVGPLDKEAIKKERL